MGYSLDPISSDCYEGTFCLINKLGIKDEHLLKELDTSFSVARIGKIENNNIEFPITPDGYKSIHRFIFEEIYDWAGEYRKINISKKGTFFADYEKIDQLMNNCFKRLSALNYFKDMTRVDYLKNVTDLYQTLNMIHPFREGNGRTERVFITLFVRLADHCANFKRVDEDELMISTIQAAGGVSDNLERVFSRIIE